MANNENKIKEEIKKDGRVNYTVPDDLGDETHVTVWLNGEKFVMKKGATVRVPKGVKEIHERSLAMKRRERDIMRDAKNKAKGII